MKKVTIVGCLPSPVGGVSVFCERLSRLIIKDDDVQIDFYDIYEGNKKNIFAFESNFNLKTPKFFNFFYTQIWLLFMLVWNKPTNLFVNFSRESSLVFVWLLSFLFRGARVYVCLHHGELNIRTGLFKFIFKRALRNVYRIYSLSPNQNDFYKEYISKEKIISTSSYLPPENVKDSFVMDKAVFKLIICGNNALHYNVITTLKGIAKVAAQVPVRHYAVTVSIYGNKCQLFEDELVDLISKIETSTFKVKVTHDLDSEQFNQLLKSQDLYIRNTSVDSFGILVADAINFGVKVLASDVCPRYCGAYVFKYEAPTSFETSLRYILNQNEQMVSCSEIDKVHFPYQSFLEVLSE